jgi:hypothetical protein
MLEDVQELSCAKHSKVFFVCLASELCSLCFLFDPVNRRLDEWVKLDQIELDSIEQEADERVDEKVYQTRPTLHEMF